MDRLVNSLIVIGSGPWAKKVQITMNESKVVDSLLHLGAREMLKMSNRELELYIKDSILWLCTNSNLQLEILKKLNRLNNKIILEKPIYNDIKDQEILRYIVKKNSWRIYFSTPWLHSRTWDNIKHVIEHSSDNLSIRIRRFGYTQRNYLYPPQDWLFHDLYLIYDLFKINTNSISIINKVWSDNNTKLSLSLQIGKVSVSMCGGLSSKREAIWDVFSKNNKNSFDFYDLDPNPSKVYFDAQNQSDSSRNNPLSRMIKHIMQTNQNNSNLQIIDLVEYLLNPV